jgi:hypothetical protein
MWAAADSLAEYRITSQKRDERISENLASNKHTELRLMGMKGNNCDNMATVIPKNGAKKRRQNKKRNSQGIGQNITGALHDQRQCKNEKKRKS